MRTAIPTKVTAVPKKPLLTYTLYFMSCSFSRWRYKMREKLRNELLLMLNKNIDSTNTLKLIEKEIDCIISNYEIEERKTNIIPYQFIPKEIEYYIVSKKIAGLSEKTLQLYCMVLKNFFKTVRKEPKDVKANDIRVYLYMYQKEHDISNRTLDCKRTIICTFFAWLASEEYIDKDPSVNISAIKYERIHKKAMSQIDLEKIRSACETKREKAIIEMLYSTGCRVTELSRLNISDVNFETKEITLFGKGDKHRVSYLNAKAEVALTEYLASRTDSNNALFVYDKKPYGRLRKEGIEFSIRQIESRIKNLSVHVTPHVFRHTTASTALERGMDIVEVSKLLGHESVQTTMQYITTSSDGIKNKHQKCVV